MKIEAGKSYRTRAGRKATIYRVGARGTHSIHGFVDADEEYIAHWTETGFWVCEECPRDHDLIAPWTETPTMDVTVLPRWATHVLFSGVSWWWSDDAIVGFRNSIPNQYAPKETVPDGSRYRIDWDNKCLVEEGGGK